MSTKYTGGFISRNAPLPNGSQASGIWTLENAMQFTKQNLWPISTIYEKLTYTITGSGTLTLTGNGTTSVDAFKTGGTAAWDTQMYCPTAFTAPCTIEYNKLAGSTDNSLSYAMISWNSDPGTDASYTSLDWASFPYQTSSYYVYNNGTGLGPYASWNSSNKFYLVYDTDGYIKHYNGSTLLISYNKGVGGTVYVDTSFYSVSGTYGGFSNIKVSRKAWNGTQYV